MSEGREGREGGRKVGVSEREKVHGRREGELAVMLL